MVQQQAATVLQHLRRLFEPGTVRELTDGQLLERYATEREPAHLQALVRRHAPLVWRVCRRVLRDPHDAEDAFQASFLAPVRRAHALQREGSLVNWLYTVALRVAWHVRAGAFHLADPPG